MIIILVAYQQQFQQQDYYQWIYLHQPAACADCDVCCVCASCDVTIDF